MNDDKTSARTQGNLTAINNITVGTTIKGDISANGDFRLDGILQGNIILTGKLVIGEKGVVEGNVDCQTANVIGAVNGNITVKDFLTLYATSRINGDITTSKLSIEPGAHFSGKCTMED